MNFRLRMAIIILLGLSGFLGIKAYSHWDSYHDLETAKKAVNNGADINAIDQYGQTPLMFAAEDGLADVAEFLIKNGADVNFKNNEGETSLMLACYCIDDYNYDGRVRIVEMLIKNEADLHAKNDSGRTALRYAAVSNFELDIIKLLVEKGALVNDPQSTGSALIDSLYNYAIWDIEEFSDKDYRNIKFLIKNGADVNARFKPDEELVSVLDIAITTGRLELVDLLIGYGATSEIKAPDAFGWAVIRKNMSDIEKLLDRDGCDLITQEDNLGITAFGYAILYNHKNIVELFLKKDPNIVKNNVDLYSDILTWASKRGYKDIVESLVKIDKSLTSVDGSDEALINAIKFGRIDVAKFLIENGINVNAKNYDEKTALMMALENGLFDIAKLLIKNGADVNRKVVLYGEEISALGYAISWAMHNKNYEMVQLLIVSGADTNVEAAKFLVIKK
ncbi:MAG: hypothetical protein SZ59_C0003G0043 [candidate division TM6 bacterium GW2011_GWF2_28_16]|nr:MAG: hypothetical protein SZ59_C0003G0043 [candidate division TM6 bacterium GW2011_GWF2_28_16]